MSGSAWSEDWQETQASHNLLHLLLEHCQLPPNGNVYTVESNSHLTASLSVLNVVASGTVQCNVFVNGHRTHK